MIPTLCILTGYIGALVLVECARILAANLSTRRAVRRRLDETVRRYQR